MKGTYTIMFPGELEIDLDCIVTADITYQEAYTTGLPEDCYPAEGDMENLEIEVLTKVDGYTQEELEGMIMDQAEDLIIDELWDDFHYNRDGGRR